MKEGFIIEGGLSAPPSCRKKEWRSIMIGVATIHSPSRATEVRFDTAVTGRRVIATLIDGVFLGGAYIILVTLFDNFEHPHAWEWNGALPSLLANLLYVLGVFLYFALLEGYYGKTFGKMVTGIQVVRADSGTVPGLAAGVIRTVLRLVDSLFAYLVAFIVVLSSEKRQRLGDLAAHTFVVRK
jgi:uncharacterized RDD family membrane protein YckC